MNKLIVLAIVFIGLTTISFAQEEKTTKSGLKYTMLVEGKGEKPQNGDKVYVNYIGKLASNGVEFDNSDGYPIDFILGEGEVIKGWDEGIALLSKGVKARLYIPANLAYGEKGYPMPEGVSIPPNADLIFEVELVKFKASK